MASNWIELPPTGGVTSLNGITGAITLAAGSGITLTPIGQTITIAATGGGGSPASPINSLQFNDSGSFGGATGTTWDKATSFLGINQATPTVPLHVAGALATIAAPTGISTSTTVAPDLVAPTVVTSQITGPHPVTGISASFSYGSGPFTALGGTVDLVIYTKQDVNGVEYWSTGAAFSLGGDDGSNQQFSIPVAWTPATVGTGYVIQVNYNSTAVGYYDIPGGLGTGNATLDGSQTVVSTQPFFNTIAFPHDPGTPPGSPSGLSITAVDVGSGSFGPADGTSYLYQCDSALTILGTIYVSGSPTTVSQADPNDGQTFNWALSYTPGTPSDNTLCRRSIDGGATWIYFFTGEASGAFTDPGTTNDPAAELRWGQTYPGPTTGTVRQYKAYGRDNGGSYYSPTGNTYGFTDTNPTDGYVILHTVTYDGSTPNTKILGQNDGQGLGNSYITAAAAFLETNNNFWTDSATVTPGHFGFLGNGAVYTFHFYSKQTSPLLYSASFATGTVTLPNTGLYYTYTLNYTTSSDSTKILRDINGGGYTAGYQVFGSSHTFTAVDPGFLDGTTVTPNTTSTGAATFENAAAIQADAAQISIKSTDATTPFAKLNFTNSFDAIMGSITSTSAGGSLALYSQLGVIDFNGTSPASTFNRFTSAQATFNFATLPNYTLKASGGSSWPNGFNYTTTAGSPTLYLGYGASLSGSNASLSVNQRDSSHQGIFIQSFDGASDAIHVENPSGTQRFTLKPNGKVNLGAMNSDAWLNVPASTSSAPNLYFQAGTKTTAGIQSGYFSYDGTDLWFADGGATFHKVSQFAAAPTLDRFPVVDANGRLDTATAYLSLNAGHSIMTSSLAAVFQQGLGVAGAGASLSVGSGVLLTLLNTQVTGSARWPYVAKTANYTLTSNDLTVNATANTFNLTLPTAVSIAGRNYVMYNSGAGVITVLTTSSQTVGGLASGAITLAQNQFLAVQADGANYIITSSNAPAVIASGGSTVSNSDGTLTISPTSGAVVASLNLAHANTWSAIQTINADLKLGTAGNGLYVKEGTNATMGTATLSGGTATVSTTKVTANSRIFLTVQGGTLTNVGATYISTRTAGTSFVISSTNILDASAVAWLICEPSP